MLNPESVELTEAPKTMSPREAGGGASRRLQWLGATTVLLVLAFCRPLIELVQLSLQNELYSHVLLVPFISLYFVWQQRQELVGKLGSSKRAALATVLGGVVLAAGFFVGQGLGWEPARVDYLAVMILSFLLFFFGACFLLAGAEVMRAAVFPAAFLFFMVPFPEVVEAGIEIFFQYTSAELSYWLIEVSGLPVLREGLVFVLPGIALEVARECSGIRSSLVLLITSLIAGHLFLKRGWTRTTLALVVIPLGIARNAVRILTLALLCVHVDPDLIHSAIHKRGGPLFFLLSLVPFFLVLLLLRRVERRRSAGRRSRPNLSESYETI